MRTKWIKFDLTDKGKTPLVVMLIILVYLVGMLAWELCRLGLVYQLG